MTPDDTEAERAHAYALLGALLAAPPAAGLLARVARIEGGDGPLGAALADLAAAAGAAEATEVRREYDLLFVGVARGELVPYASYYLTGFLNEKPLARLRRDIAGLGIARAEANPDPEDHIASLCEMMAGLIAGAFDPAAAPMTLPRQRAFFDRHLRPWVGRFFADLEGAEGARFYRPVGAVGRAFVNVETNAFALVA